MAVVGVVNGIAVGIEKKLRLEAKEDGLESVLAEIETLLTETKHAAMEHRHGQFDSHEMSKLQKDFKRLLASCSHLMQL